MTVKGKEIVLNLQENKRWEGMIRVLHLFVVPFSTLTDTEIKVLGQLLYWFYQEDGNFEERNLKLFDYNTKVIIANDLKLSLASLENCLMSLRMKKLVVGLRKTRQLNPSYLLSDDFNRITYTLKQ